MLVSTGLAAATLLGTAPDLFAQVRDHRQNPQAESGPREAPPSPREERHEARRDGFVWIGGRWDWRRSEHRWDWIAGHWEREKRGHKWREARWERRGDEWVMVDGDWIQVDVRPTQAPPPPREERFDNRPGFVWVRGRWDWRDGNWVWVDGHRERERATQRWIEGRWELRGDHWEWIEGSWGAMPEFPALGQPPPPPQRDDTRLRVEPGTFIVPGFWGWANGQYTWQHPHLERLVPGSHYEPGHWTQASDHWVWNRATWVKDAPPPPPYNPPPGGGPTSAPPPPRDERVEPREGFVWARGHHEWRGNQYEWIPGHWERARARLTWYDGRWEQRGNVWVYVEGGWR
jgi:hypothetical protein